jgi:hypothetical protein
MKIIIIIIVGLLPIKTLANHSFGLSLYSLYSPFSLTPLSANNLVNPQKHVILSNGIGFDYSKNISDKSSICVNLNYFNVDRSYFATLSKDPNSASLVASNLSFGMYIMHLSGGINFETKIKNSKHFSAIIGGNFGGIVSKAKNFDTSILNSTFNEDLNKSDQIFLIKDLNVKRNNLFYVNVQLQYCINKNKKLKIYPYIEYRQGFNVNFIEKTDIYLKYNGNYQIRSYEIKLNGTAYIFGLKFKYDNFNTDN